jgi:group I intron endonuclease
MKKYIYKITNIINKKCYIGQTQNYKTRFAAHKNALRKNQHENPHLQLAWNKYGEENFKFEIIEHIENYNEREIYWISFYQSTDKKYGYNIMAGGEEPPHINGSKISQQQAETIRKLLMNANTVDEVLELYPNITKGHLNKINQGKAWKDENLQYPLCNPNPDVFTAEEVDLIIADLVSGDLTQKEIAKKYNCSRTSITAINCGAHFYKENIDYPIRKSRICKLTTTDVMGIVALLQDDTYSMKQIADMYNTTLSSICDINSGRRHRNMIARDVYPIRQ